jgi:RES domain-containing protein
VEAYRLIHSRYAEDVSGFGAYKAGGRWNPKGYYALYVSEHPCGAILESLIHMPPQIIPDDYCLVSYSITNTSMIETIDEAELPESWRSGMYDPAVFQNFGRDRLFNKNLLGLYIHSAPAHPSHNYIFNPKHEQFADSVRISDVNPYVFDSRLMQIFEKA